LVVLRMIAATGPQPTFVGCAANGGKEPFVQNAAGRMNFRYRDLLLIT